MATGQTISGISVFPVKPERAQDFERFCVDVVGSAVAKVRGHMQGKWQVLRPAEEADGATCYAVVFHAGNPEEDWDLESLLQAAYGDDEAQRYGDEWMGFMAGEQHDYMFTGALNP
jgi:hypothetical protein